MRLGYLVPDWPGQTHAFFWREIRALRDVGHEVVLFSTRAPAADASAHAFAAAAAETRYLYPPSLPAGLRTLLTRPVGIVRALAYVVRLDETRWRDRLRLFGILACAADLAACVRARQIEHVHAHSCADSAHLLAMAALIGRFGYSLTLHGDLPVYGVDQPAKMRSAAFVTTVTRPLRDQIIAATGWPTARVPIITMGVDTDVFSPAHSRPPDRPFHLLTIARLNHTKGHVLALQALRRVRALGRDVRYTIAGDGPERAAIIDCIDELGLHDAVTMTGGIGEHAVAGLLRDAHAFILSSFGLGEAAPVSVMEAMAAGLPVICSRIGGTPDMIDDTVSGLLVDQQDVDGLAAALSMLVDDPALCARLGTAARARAVADFDYRTTARALGDEIVKAIAQRSAATSGRVRSIEDPDRSRSLPDLSRPSN